METSNIIEGLTILQKYRARQDGFDCGAEHDALYAFPTDQPLERTDIERMIFMGWHQEHDGRDYNSDYGIEDYRIDESWVSYV